MIARRFQKYFRQGARELLDTLRGGTAFSMNRGGLTVFPRLPGTACCRINHLGSLATIAVGVALTPVGVMAEPYLVSGNQHIVIGITLDEDAVRAALPPGLEPAEGMTGGINLFNSGGGDGVDPFQRSYIWVDLDDLISVTGLPGRYTLWMADSVNSEEIKREWGHAAEAGSTELEIGEETATGITTVGGAPVLTVSVDLGSDDCGAGAGSINYTGAPVDGDGAMIVAQYAYSAEFCPASPASVEITAPEGHVLNDLEPTSLTWAVLARDLTMAASPNFPYEP